MTSNKSFPLWLESFKGSEIKSSFKDRDNFVKEVYTKLFESYSHAFREHSFSKEEPEWKKSYKALEERVANLEAFIGLSPERRSKAIWDVEELRANFTKQEIESCKNLISKEIQNRSLFPSDLAEKYSLDYRLVYLCFKELETEGVIE